MRILITNDDGYSAPGIRAIYEALEGLGERWLVAPADQRSGVSHAFTICNPIRVDTIDWVEGNRGYAVHGMPVDAVKLAMRSLMPSFPDLVVSGINSGENTGVDLLYSGTVAAAMEGALYGIPSIAISLTTHDQENSDFSIAQEFGRKICEEVISRGLPPGVVINVNVPVLSREEILGVKITSQAESRYDEEVEFRPDENGGQSIWLDYKKVLTGTGSGTDIEAIRNGYISVSPIQAKFTNHDLLSIMNMWKLKK